MIFSVVHARDFIIQFPHPGKYVPKYKKFYINDSSEIKSILSHINQGYQAAKLSDLIKFHTS